MTAYNRPKRHEVAAWAAAVRALLQAAKITDQELVWEIESRFKDPKHAPIHSVSVLARFLPPRTLNKDGTNRVIRAKSHHQTRVPSQDVVMEINDAMERLLHNRPRVSAYLDSVYLHGFVEDRPHEPEEEEALTHSFRVLSEYFREGGIEDFARYVRGVDPRKLLRLSKYLSACYGARLLRDLIGDKEPAKSEVHEICDAFKKHAGLDPREWFASDEENWDVFARDEFSRSVRIALKSIHDPALRYETEQKIMEAFLRFNYRDF